VGLGRLTGYHGILYPNANFGLRKVESRFREVGPVKTWGKNYPNHIWMGFGRDKAGNIYYWVFHWITSITPLAPVGVWGQQQEFPQMVGTACNRYHWLRHLPERRVKMVHRMASREPLIGCHTGIQYHWESGTLHKIGR